MPPLYVPLLDANRKIRTVAGGHHDSPSRTTSCFSEGSYNWAGEAVFCIRKRFQAIPLDW